jgi:hypothetical protein
MERAELIRDVERDLPEFAKACKSDSDVVLMAQQAFIGLDECELLLFGKAVKYAGLMGKELTIIP